MKKNNKIKKSVSVLAFLFVLLNLILTAAGESTDQKYLTDNVNTECCYYPEGKQLVVINNADTEQTATVKTDAGDKTVTLSAFDTQIVQL